MKSTNSCPKCSSNDILHIPGWVGAYGTGNNVPVKTFGIGSSAYALIDRYLCSACGFSEEWVGKDEIEKLKKKYASP